MNGKLPLLQALLEYSKENNVIFSMPGNKSGKAFSRDEIGKKFKEEMGNLDITEVEPLDNLQNPEGIIKEAQKHLANLYKVKNAYFTVNGSTSGNLSAVFAAFDEGDSVLVERTCHKSIHNAIILRKLKVTYIESKVTDYQGIFYPPDKDDIYQALKKAGNAKGIILTYPNYFGISYELTDIIKDLKNRNMKVIIDQAHGAHYGISDKLPESLAPLADYTIVSAHKTLPALTSGAYILTNDVTKDIGLYINTFVTTSPSYLIMASLDYARYYLEVYGKLDFEKLIDKAEKYKEQINKTGKVKILSDSDLNEGYHIDKTRYIITVENGYSGYKLLEYLRKKKIQAEMAFEAGVVLILSYSNFKEEADKLKQAIDDLNLEDIKTNFKGVAYKRIIPKKILEPYQVFSLKSSYIPIDKAEGKVAMEAIVPYPPGIPLISSGDLINKEIIEQIKLYIESKVTILGVNNNMIKVVEKGEK